MTADSKGQMFDGRRDRQVFGRCAVALLFAELREAKSVEYVSVRVCFSISLNSPHRERHERTSGDGHAVGERERTEDEARYPHFMGGARTFMSNRDVLHK